MITTGNKLIDLTLLGTFKEECEKTFASQDEVKEIKDTLNGAHIDERGHLILGDPLP